MADLELHDLEMTRGLLLGSRTDVQQDDAITEWKGPANRYVYDAIKKFAPIAVPFVTGQEAYVTDNHKLAASAKLAELVAIEKKRGKEAVEMLRLLAEDSIKKIIEAYGAEPTDRTSPSVSATASFASSLINENDWNGTNSDIGSPLGPT